MLNRRLQVLLDDDRHDRLERFATERGVSVASVVREALDRMLGIVHESRRAAGRRLLDASTMQLDEWDAVKQEINGLNERKG